MTFRSSRYFSILTLSFLSMTSAGCSSSEKGITVSLGVVHHASADSKGNIDAQPSGKPRVFTNNLGYEITLSSAYIVYSKVEMHACETSQLFPRLMRWLSPIEMAQAHSAGSATALGVPSVENLLAQDLEFKKLGDIEPPAGTYCHVEVTLGRADDDAQYLPSKVNMVGKTLVFSGKYIPVGGGPAQAFTVESSNEVAQELGFHEGDNHEAKLTLTSDNPEQTLVVRIKYDALFEDVDFTDMSKKEISAKVLANSASSLHQYTSTYTEAK